MLYSLSHINETSPYKVMEYEEDTACFITDNGVVYMVGFVEDTNLEIPNAYQFFITPKGRNKSVGVDPKIGETIVRIIQSFFKNDKNVLIYICDTSDRLQAARNRKFKMWFHQYAESDAFNFVSEEVLIGDDKYFAAMITTNSHGLKDVMAESFHNYFHTLRDKLE